MRALHYTIWRHLSTGEYILFISLKREHATSATLFQRLPNIRLTASGQVRHFTKNVRFVIEKRSRSSREIITQRNLTMSSQSTNSIQHVAELTHHTWRKCTYSTSWCNSLLPRVYGECSHHLTYHNSRARNQSCQPTLEYAQRQITPNITC